jgi:hypothetical protein
MLSGSMRVHCWSSQGYGPLATNPGGEVTNTSVLSKIVVYKYIPQPIILFKITPGLWNQWITQGFLPYGPKALFGAELLLFKAILGMWELPQDSCDTVCLYSGTLSLVCTI